jgi:hypothetical protein
MCRNSKNRISLAFPRFGFWSVYSCIGTLAERLGSRSPRAMRARLRACLKPDVRRSPSLLAQPERLTKLLTRCHCIDFVNGQTFLSKRGKSLVLSFRTTIWRHSPIMVADSVTAATASGVKRKLTTRHNGENLTHKRRSRRLQD